MVVKLEHPEIAGPSGGLCVIIYKYTYHLEAPNPKSSMDFELSR